MKVQNATVLPKVYYGLHFSEGCAEYVRGNDSYKLFVREQTMKNMDKSFLGRPVYVGHVPDVNLENLENEADGYVVDSFFNKSDGKHWAKFIVVTDRGHEAIAKGWKLSNSYIVKSKAGGGKWHGMEYEFEVMDAEYEHLAIVSDPRYNESIILTPEQFKAYNEKKEGELLKLANSNTATNKNKTKGENNMFTFFKKEKVENSSDLEQMSVTLPKSKKEVSVSQIINAADEAELAKGKTKQANGDDMVTTNGGDMSVADLTQKYNELLEKAEAVVPNEDDKKDDKKKSNEDKKDEKKKENKKSNKEDEDVDNEDEDVENEDDEEVDNEDEEEEKKEKKSNSMSNFKKLKDQDKVSNEEDFVVVNTMEDAIARGKSRYGSK